MAFVVEAMPVLVTEREILLLHRLRFFVFDINLLDVEAGEGDAQVHDHELVTGSYVGIALAVPKYFRIVRNVKRLNLHVFFQVPQDQAILLLVLLDLHTNPVLGAARPHLLDLSLLLCRGDEELQVFEALVTFVDVQVPDVEVVEEEDVLCVHGQVDETRPE